MKKNNLLLILAIVGSAILFITGCSKDDTTPPVISVTGATSETVSLNHSWTDQGATATDDEDGSVTVTTDANSGNPNLAVVGTYTITYSATDAAGNKGSAIRTVRVKNDAEGFAKDYIVTDNVNGGSSSSYSQKITVDNTINFKVHFNRFGDYNNNTEIYGVMDSVTGKLWIPNQSSGHDIGTAQSPPQSCDVVKHWFRNTVFTSLTTGFFIEYVDSLANNGAPCDSSVITGTMQFAF